MLPERSVVDALARWASAPGGGLDRRRLAVICLAAYLAFAASYLAVNVFSIGRRAHHLWLPGEERIPFVPEFEFLYVLSYVLPLLVVFRLPDVRRLRQAILAFPLMLAVAYTTYLLFPVYLERPALRVDSIATFLLSLEYHDPSYNHFPSLHVATSWFVYFACRDAIPRRGWMVTLLVGVAVSTLFVKRHYLVDVLYGVALAAAAWVTAGRALGGASRGSASATGPR